MLVTMIVRHLRTMHELLAVLEQPTAEMEILRSLLCEAENFSSRRTWERRFKDLPANLPALIGCLGRSLVELIDPWQPRDERWPSIAPFCELEAGSSIRSIASKGWFPIAPSIKKRIGPNPVRMEIASFLCRGKRLDPIGGRTDRSQCL